MGMTRVLKELEEKYGLKKTEPVPISTKKPNEGLKESMMRVLDEFDGRRDSRLAWLRDLAKERHVMPAREFEMLCGVSKMLREFVYQNPRATAENLRTLESRLDALDLWVSKFRTECAGGASGHLPLQPSSPDDSVYYVTPSGATLRLKMVQRDRGTASVIQVFMEKILFLNSIENITSETPRVNYHVYEFASPSLNSAIESGNMAEYHPALDVFRENGNLEAVDQMDGRSGKLTLNYWRHPGDRVNAILSLPHARKASA